MNRLYQPESNPFEPPEALSVERVLQSDTEFLVSGTSLLCEEQVHLPPVCVLTGQKNDVREVSRKLRWTPQVLSVLRFSATLIGLPLLIPLFDQFINGELARHTETQRLFEVSMLGFLAIVVPGVWVLTWVKTRTVHAHWFINSRSLLISRITTWVMRGILVAVAGFVMYTLASAAVSTPVLVIAGLVLLLFWKGQAPVGLEPQFAGRHEGLNVLVMRQPFIDRINEMIAVHNVTPAPQGPENGSQV